MGVLAAILANARRIALDVTGIERRLVERRREQQHETIAAMHELAVERCHRLDRARRIAGPRQCRPGLRDGIDPALLARRRAERRAVIVVAAPIPLAIPGRGIERDAQGVGMGLPGPHPGRLLARRGDRDEGGERCVQEPAQPDALALARLADAIHAVVPVAGAHQRQAVRAGGEREVEAAGAVLEQRRRLVGLGRLEIEVVVGGLQGRAVDERHPLVEDGQIARGLDIVRGDRGEP